MPWLRRKSHSGKTGRASRSGEGPDRTALVPQPGDKLNTNIGLGVSLILTLIIVVFHIIRMVKAGGLWRDEAAAVQLAAMPSIREVMHFFPHEAFPLLVPGVLRGYGAIFGSSDWAWRAFGAVVGLLIVGMLWLNLTIFRRGTPLLSLALLGFNGAFVQWGDSIRGYGLGTVFVLLTVGMVWRVIEKPSTGHVVAAALAAIASVQCLFQNSVLLLAICLGGMAVAERRGSRRTVGLVLVVGLAAAASLLPYWVSLSRARDWDVLTQADLAWDYICLKLGQSFSSSGSWMIVVWLGLLLAGVIISFAAQLRRGPIKLKREDQDLLLFSAIALCIGLPGYLIFLGIVSHPVQEWHLVALVGFTGLFIGVMFATLRQHRWRQASQLVIALLIAGFCLVPTWKHVRVRMTNVDLIAVKVRQLASKDDLILVSRWYFGISFQRYFAGPGSWTNVPELGFNLFHRYDLIKPLMMMPHPDDPIRPIIDQIDKTLKSGHRVWLVGQWKLPPPGEQLPELPPAPSERYKWQEYRYTVMWGAKIEQYLQVRAARTEDIQMPLKGAVNEFEDLWLKLFEEQ